MNRSIWTAISCVLLAANSVLAGSPTPPKGWRFPTKADEKGDWVVLAKPGQPAYHARADFNGDGIPDDAYIAIAANGKGWGLFVNLNAKKGKPRIVKLDEDAGDTKPQRMGVSVVDPGTYKTACGKGYWDCKGDEPEELSLKTPAIDYILFESANSFFWWDSRVGKFTRTWMSD